LAGSFLSTWLLAFWETTVNVIAMILGTKGQQVSSQPVARPAERRRPQNLLLSCAHGSDLHIGASQIPGLPIEPVPTYVGDKHSRHGRFSAINGVLGLPRTMLRFGRLLHRHKIDVALCAHSAIWDIATIPWLMYSPYRFVLVVHELRAPHGEYVRGLRNRQADHQLSLTDAIVVLSDEIKRQVIEQWGYPTDRCWKTPHASYVFGSQRPELAVHPRGKRPIHLLFFGRITQYKGLHRLSAAVDLLRRRGIAFKLTIAGSGDLDDYRQQLTAPDVEAQNSWLDEEAVANALAVSDIVVFPYDLSSQSGIAAAACAVGRPVVAAPVGGLNEQVLPSTGVLAKDMSAEAFAEALPALIRDPALFDYCAVGALYHAQTASDWQPLRNHCTRRFSARPRRSTRRSDLCQRPRANT
jgi:glycosyltransferase involved in cell wall biosynthesis